MSKTIVSFENSLQKAYDWLDDMVDAIEWNADREDAYHAMRVGLHFVRDRLLPDEVAHLSDQLPLLIRGIYYEGWNPSNTPLDVNTYEELSGYLAEHIQRDLPADPMLIFGALFKVLHKYLTLGLLEDVQSMLPATMRTFYPNITVEK